MTLNELKNKLETLCIKGNGMMEDYRIEINLSQDEKDFDEVQVDIKREVIKIG